MAFKPLVSSMDLDTLLRTYLCLSFCFLKRQFEKCRKIPKEIEMTVIIRRKEFLSTKRDTQILRKSNGDFDQSKWIDSKEGINFYEIL